MPVRRSLSLGSFRQLVRELILSTHRYLTLADRDWLGAVQRNKVWGGDVMGFGLESA